MSNLLIIDDHQLFRDGLKMILGQVQDDYAILEAGTVMEAIDRSVAESEAIPDLILMDIQMPGLNGLDGMQLVKERFPGRPLIILSASNEVADRDKAIQRGACAYINKSTSAEKICGVVAAALSGNLPADQDLINEGSDRNDHSPLTVRQLEVLGLLCEGKSNKLIARSLGVSENTVRGHVSAILSYFDASSRTEVTVIAQRQGLVSLSA